MRTLRIPSVQHLARNWHASPERVCKKLVRLYENPPAISYAALAGAIHDRFVYRQPLDEILNGLKRSKAGAEHIKDLTQIMALIDDHFGLIDVRYFNSVSRRFYPVGRGLLVPFDPPILYGTAAGRHFPWFSFWARNPLAGEQLSLFVTLVVEMLREDPELDAADLQIVDLSRVEPDGERTVRLVPIASVPILTDARKTEMLEVFAEGFIRAKEMVSNPGFQADLRERRRKGQGSPEKPTGDGLGDNPLGF